MSSKTFRISPSNTVYLDYTVTDGPTGWALRLNSIRLVNSGDGTGSSIATSVAVGLSSTNYNVAYCTTGSDAAAARDMSQSYLYSRRAALGVTTLCQASKTFKKGTTDTTSSVSSASFTIEKKKDAAISGPYLLFSVHVEGSSSQYARVVSDSLTISKRTEYAVTFSANGGTGAPGTQKKYHGETLTLSSTKPTRTGYSFWHWNTNASNTGTTYEPGGGYTANAALALHAIWNPVISYNANGGSGAPASQTKTFNQTLTLSSTKPTRTGYTFLGWAESSTGAVAYQPGAVMASSQNAAKTLYAKWKLNNPTVTAKPYRILPGSLSEGYTSGKPADEDDEGTSVALSFTAKNGGYSGSYITKVTATVNGHTVTYSPGSNVTQLTGYLTIHAACDTEKAYSGTITVSATGAEDVTLPFRVQQAFQIMDFNSKGHSIGLGGPAKPSGSSLNIYLPTYVDESSVVLKDSRIPASGSAAVSANAYGYGFYLTDAAGLERGYIRDFALTTGAAGIQLEAKRVVGGSNYYDTLILGLMADGSKYSTFQSKVIDWLSTTTVSQIITANTTNVTITSASYVQFMHLAMVYIRFTNKAAISVPASGNITNLQVGTLVSGKRPAILCTPHSTGDEAGAAWYNLTSAGVLALGAVEGTGAARTIAAGQTFSLAATYILA